MAKIGRNDPCPCGNGRKYKKCHGLVTGSSVSSPPFTTRQVKLEDLPERARVKMFSQMAEASRRHAQRVQKFGHVRPPVVVNLNGQTLIAVGNRLHFGADWKTFHDFL